MGPEYNEEHHSEIEADRKSMIAHNSMVTVRLSEPQLTIDTKATEVVTEVAEEDGVSAELKERDESPRITMQDHSDSEPESTILQNMESRRGSDSSEGSDRVNWEELEKTEEKEPRDQGSDDV
jgi:hypothetical protein